MDKTINNFKTLSILFDSIQNAQDNENVYSKCVEIQTIIDNQIKEFDKFLEEKTELYNQILHDKNYLIHLKDDIDCLLNNRRQT